jgi:hypothetical protein
VISNSISSFDINAGQPKKWIPQAVSHYTTAVTVEEKVKNATATGVRRLAVVSRGVIAGRVHLAARSRQNSDYSPQVGIETATCLRPPSRDGRSDGHRPSGGHVGGLRVMRQLDVEQRYFRLARYTDIKRLPGWMLRVRGYLSALQARILTQEK